MTETSQDAPARLYLAGPFGLTQSVSAVRQGRAAVSQRSVQRTRQAILDTEAVLNRAGWDVRQSPGATLTQDEHLELLASRDQQQTYIDRCREILQECAGVAVLQVWRQSSVARLEVSLARRLTMLVQPVATWVTEAPPHPDETVEPLSAVATTHLCPECGVRVMIKRDRTLRMHRVRGTKSRRHPWEVTCPGSGRHVAESGLVS